VVASAWPVDRAGRRQLKGVGFCLSHLAQFREISVGNSSAGEAIREIATSGAGAPYPASGGPAAGH
jgi:hypothetical protein